MGAILGVSRGSAEPPRVMEIRYGNEDAEMKLAFVGKGLTFDSGGLSLKTVDGMMWMKGDMGGAGCGRSHASHRPASASEPQRTWDNRCCGKHARTCRDKAGRRSANNERQDHRGAQYRCRGTVGPRGYAYVRRTTGATHIVDLATLTGAVVVALGHEAAGLMGNSVWWTDRVRQAGGHLEASTCKPARRHRTPKRHYSMPVHRHQTSNSSLDGCTVMGCQTLCLTQENDWLRGPGIEFRDRGLNLFHDQRVFLRLAGSCQRLVRRSTGHPLAHFADGPRRVAADDGMRVG